jgi:hypothetical protein
MGQELVLAQSQLFFQLLLDAAWVYLQILCRNAIYLTIFVCGMHEVTKSGASLFWCRAKLQ